MKKNGIEIPDVVLHLLALPLLPLVAIILPVLFVLRQAVRLWLQIKFGDRFVGLLCAADKIYTPQVETSKKVIQGIIYVRCDEKIDLMHKIVTRLTEKFTKRPDDYPKLVSTLHSFLGQDFLLKTKISLDKILKVMPLPPENNVTFDEEYIKILTGELANSPLPENDTVLWEVYIAAEPMSFKHPNVKGFVYPVITRFHHSLADGVRLFTLLGQFCGVKFDSKAYNKFLFQKPAEKMILDDLVMISKLVLSLVYLTLIGVVTYLNATFLKEKDVNSIHGQEFSGDKIMVWSIEYEQRYVPMVKKIKNRMPNTRFTDVVFACISASICNYFKKNHGDVPEKISCIIPILLNYMPSDKSKPVELKNEFTFGMLDMPLVDPSDFLNGLGNIKGSMENLRKSPVKDLIYWMVNYIAAVLPGPIIKLLLNTKAYTAIISSLPGASHLTLFQNCDLLATISTAPHANHTGVTFTCLTYDDKFHISLFVDKAIIPKQEDAQYIVDEIFRNIDLLNETSLKVYG